MRKLAVACLLGFALAHLSAFGACAQAAGDAPADADVLALKAQAHRFYDAGQYDRAIQLFNRLMAVAADSELLDARGNAYLETGAYDQALADFMEAIRRDPANAQVFIDRGVAYYLMGDAEKAVADDSEAIRLNTTNSAAFSNRAAAYMKLKRLDLALADDNEAIRRSPDKADFYDNRGLTYAALHDYDRAIADYEQAVRLNPQDDTAVDNLKTVKRERDRLALVNPPAAPTFDCARAQRAVEKAICSDTELVQIDRDMNAAYQSALARLPATKAAALRRDQRVFLANRDRMFGRPSYQLRLEMQRRATELSAMGR